MSSLLFAVTGAVVLAMALHRAVVARAIVEKLIALNVLGTGVFLVLVAMARRGEEGPDPVPHALVLTGIVVTVAATGLALSLVRRRAMDEPGARLPEDEGRDAGEA